MRCLERLRPYLLGIKFRVFTDCEAFQRTMSKKNATARVARWALALEEYDVEIKHRLGSKMAHLDALSRNAIMIVEHGVFDRIRQAQDKNAECAIIKQLIEKGGTTPHVLRSGVIYYYENGDYKLRVPKSMAESIIRQAHGDAHLRKQKIQRAINNVYHIEELGKKIDRIVDNCVICILATAKKGKEDGWLHLLEKYDVPLHTLHIDHTGQLESTIHFDSYRRIQQVYLALPNEKYKLCGGNHKTEDTTNDFRQPSTNCSRQGDIIHSERF